MPDNGERDLAEQGHMAGTGWATRIERRLEEGEQRFARIETRQREHADGLLRLDGKIVRMGADHGRRHAELLGAIEGLRRGRAPQRSRPDYPEYSDEDANQITDVTDPETLRSRARTQRAEAELWKHRRNRAIAIGPATGAVLGAAIVAILRALGWIPAVALALTLLAAPAHASSDAPTDEQIVGALLALPGATLTGDLDRAATVARAIRSASLEAVCAGPWSGADWCEVVWPGTRTELAALLVVIGYAESRFAAHVQAGRCRRHECDAIVLGGRVFHRARSYWQLHASPLVPLSVWRTVVGLEYHPTANAAYAAATVLGEGRRRCGSIEGALAAYATGRSCRWAPAAGRAAMARRVCRALEAS